MTILWYFLTHQGWYPKHLIDKMWGCCHWPWLKSPIEPRNELTCNWSPLSTRNCKGAWLKGNYRLVNKGKPWMILWDLLNFHVQGMSLVCTLWQKHWCAQGWIKLMMLELVVCYSLYDYIWKLNLLYSNFLSV